MIREYTSQPGGGPDSGGERTRVRLEPVLILDGKDTSLEFKVGITRFYACADLRGPLRRLLRMGHVAYGRTCGAHPQIGFYRQQQGASGPCLWEEYKQKARSAA
ncbi:MAG: hypothetical protein ACLR0U_18610 [Enterocloster clostridioformis]